MLERFYFASKKYKADIIVRITADCPLIDPSLIDLVILEYQKNNIDYISNACIPTFPDGLDTEVFSFSALQKAYKEAVKSHEKEHVTPYIRESGKFKIQNYSCEFDYSSFRWTVDEPEDFKVVENVFNFFMEDKNFSWIDVIDYKSRILNYLF